MTQANRTQAPISMRLPEDDIALIDRAASLRGRSRTEFVREAAVRAAEETIMESHPIRLSAEAFADFLRAVSGAPKPVPELVEVMHRRAPWEAGEGE